MRVLVLATVAFLAPAAALAQIRVNPTGVNVNGQGATTEFLTFGPLDGWSPLESFWCGELVPAAPALGLACDPSTIFGSLPARYDLSHIGSNNTFTDIMSVPASVARRAYQAAVAGSSAEFFYVRHFVKSGAPDQFVAVTCRLTAGGARVPLSLVDVRLAFDVDTPVLLVRSGGTPPPLSASLVYTGSGRLRGRWEVVLPGQELPSVHDLLPEASLPLDERGTQRRYAEIDRFTVFLDPSGRATIPGPDPGTLPTGVDGEYLVLFRVEVSDDKEADSDLSALGVGAGVVHAGGAAGFPMPVLRYVVGTGGNGLSPDGRSIEAAGPIDGADIDRTRPVDLEWRGGARASYYRIDITSGGRTVHQALLSPEARTYRLPPFVLDRAATGSLQWRVAAVDGSGRDIAVTPWREMRVGGPASLVR
jgi:hypothetical protein